MNITILKGNICKDITLTFAQGSGTGIAKFSVAVSRMKKDDPSDFFNCTAFGKTAELIAERLSKGSPILITGHLQTGSYTNKSDVKVYTTDVIVDKFDFVGGKKEDGQETSTNNRNEVSEVEDLSDIPF